MLSLYPSSLRRSRPLAPSLAGTMSKNTQGADFRKVDVDELDDEMYRDDPDTGAGEEDEAAVEVSKREQEVKRLTATYPPEREGRGGRRVCTTLDVVIVPVLSLAQ